MDAALLALLVLVVLGLALAHAAALRRRDRRALALLAGLDVVALGLVLLAAFDRGRFEALAQEDGVVEWATVFSWLAAAALYARGARAALSTRSAPGRGGLLPGLALVATAAFCLFVAGEEISWGQRLFAFQPPEAFLELNYQQELNVHNLLMDDRVLGFKLQSKHLVAAVAVVFGLALPLSARAGRPAALAPTLHAVAPPLSLSPSFLLVALAEIAYPVELTGEAAELFLGAAFFAAALARTGASTAALPLALLLPLALGAGTAVLVDRVLFGSDEERTRQAEEELALLGEDLARRGAVQAKIWSKSSVHRRVFTATRVGYLRFADSAFLEGKESPGDPRASGELRRDRRGYFLDPWNNPYWIYFHRKSGHLALYSFGPNRQRDTRVKKRRGPAGDDVMVVLSIDRGGDPADGDDDEREDP